jgi:hypothetical protein
MIGALSGLLPATFFDALPRLPATSWVQIGASVVVTQGGRVQRRDAPVGKPAASARLGPAASSALSDSSSSSSASSETARASRRSRAVDRSIAAAKASGEAFAEEAPGFGTPAPGVTAATEEGSLRRRGFTLLRLVLPTCVPWWFAVSTLTKNLLIHEFFGKVSDGSFRDATLLAPFGTRGIGIYQPLNMFANVGDSAQWVQIYGETQQGHILDLIRGGYPSSWEITNFENVSFTTPRKFAHHRFSKFFKKIVAKGKEFKMAEKVGLFEISFCNFLCGQNYGPSDSLRLAVVYSVKQKNATVEEIDVHEDFKCPCASCKSRCQQDFRARMEPKVKPQRLHWRFGLRNGKHRRNHSAPET